MTNEERKKLSGFYKSLRNMKPVFDERARNRYTSDQETALVVASELQRLEAAFPNLVPHFHLAEFQARGSDRPAFRSEGICAHLAVVIGRLEAELEENESVPVTELKEFPFLRDAKLREVVERDYQELQRAFVTRCWKATLILAGGTIEAILLDQLLRDPSAATSASSAPRNVDLAKWSLDDLIKVAVELRKIPLAVEKLAGPIREYRNLIHAGNEIRTGLTFGGEEARIAVEVVNIVHRELAA